MIRLEKDFQIPKSVSSYRIHFRHEHPIDSDFCDPDDGAITHFRGEIYLVDDDGFLVLPAGVIEGHVALLYSGFHPFDMFDSHSHELLQFYEALFDKDGELSQDFEATSSILILNRLDILPEFRGFGLGLAAVYETIKRIGDGCAVCAIQACPIQYQGGRDKDTGESFAMGVVDKWSSAMKIDSFTNDNEQKETEKLIEYYGYLGFVRYNNKAIDNLLVLDMALNQPKLKNLVEIGVVKWNL